MQNDIAIANVFNPIRSVQDIKIFSANGDVFIKSFWRNIFGVGMDGERKAMRFVPFIDCFHEEDAVLKCGVTDSPNAFTYKFGFERPRKSHCVRKRI